jgi:hypothetical protein
LSECLREKEEGDKKKSGSAFHNIVRQVSTACVSGWCGAIGKIVSIFNRLSTTRLRRRY